MKLSRRDFALLATGLPTPLASQQPAQTQLPDLSQVPPDLVVPPLSQLPPAPGLRVRQTLVEYERTQIHHTLYLPTDWKPGRRYPVLVEFAGNGPYTSKFKDFSPGTVEGSVMGYGLTAGKGAIWLCLPFVNPKEGINQLWWWGDVAATVNYAIAAVSKICAEFGGDANTVILSGFSRGAIACNYIGLHNDQIAKLWRGFLAYSHYDGVRSWDYEGSGRQAALVRLHRLHGRPVLICQEGPVDGAMATTRSYIEGTGIQGDFTYLPIGFRNHTDAWTLRNIPARKQARRWLQRVIG